MERGQFADQVIIPNLPWIIAGGVILGFVAVMGWIFTTWLRIKNEYPLENSLGMPIHPKNDPETAEGIRLLTTENAQLRAEMGSLKDRLETLERIATDQPVRLAHEIDALTIDRRGTA